MTLASSPTTTTMLPITDSERAQAFYSDVLGLPFNGTNTEGSLIFGLAAGATLGLMSRPAGSRAEHTAVSFEVDDILSAMPPGSSTGRQYPLPAPDRLTGRRAHSRSALDDTNLAVRRLAAPPAGTSHSKSIEVRETPCASDTSGPARSTRHPS